MIRRICKRNVDKARENQSIVEAAKHMRDRNVGTLAVIDENERPIGFLTDRDLVVRVLAEARLPWTTSVGDVMTTPAQTISDDTPIEEALAQMRALGVRRLLVVGRDGELVGVVSLDDFLHLFVSEFQNIDGILAGARTTAAF